MKRSIILLFTFYFFLASTGVVFGTHQCGKKVSYTLWGIPLDADGCKCPPKAAKKAGCCKHESEWLKADTDDTKTSNSDFQLKQSEKFIVAVFIYSFVPQIIDKQGSSDIQLDHSPPRCDLPIFLRNRSILI
jgi:hypothetical protein